MHSVALCMRVFCEIIIRNNVKERLEELIDPELSAKDYPMITLLKIRNIIRDNEGRERFKDLYKLVSREINARAQNAKLPE
jgi:hypothetical protein